jgi:hypothetical protein
MCYAPTSRVAMLQKAHAHHKNTAAPTRVVILVATVGSPTQ